MLNRQMIADRIATHLLTQREKSRDVVGLCLYRGPNGRKCAIGILIPDSKYKKKMEGGGIMLQPLARILQEEIGCCSVQESAFLIAFQNIHDCFHPHEWLYGLCRVYKAQSLDTWHLRMCVIAQALDLPPLK